MALLSYGIMAKMAVSKTKKISRYELGSVHLKLSPPVVSYHQGYVFHFSGKTVCFRLLLGFKVEFHRAQSWVCWATQRTNEAVSWKDVALESVSRRFQISSDWNKHHATGTAIIVKKNASVKGKWRARQAGKKLSYVTHFLRSSPHACFAFYLNC